jgi:hypothetical protein
MRESNRSVGHFPDCFMSVLGPSFHKPMQGRIGKMRNMLANKTQKIGSLLGSLQGTARTKE